MTNHTIKIDWPAGGKETVPLGNLNNLSVGQRLISIETSDGWDGFTRYSPKIISLANSGTTSYSITLSYVRSEHEGDALESEYWGTSTIVIDTLSLYAEATWRDERQIEKFNGPGVARLLVEPQFSERPKRISSNFIRDPEINKQVRSLDLVCAITGEATRAVLEVAHILEVANSGSDSLSNCFLLRVDLHRLFDAGLLRFTEEGMVHFEPTAIISEDYRKMLSNGRIAPETYRRIKQNLTQRMTIKASD